MLHNLKAYFIFFLFKFGPTSPYVVRCRQNQDIYIWEKKVKGEGGRYTIALFGPLTSFTARPKLYHPLWKSTSPFSIKHLMYFITNERGERKNIQKGRRVRNNRGPSFRDILSKSAFERYMGGWGVSQKRARGAF